MNDRKEIPTFDEWFKKKYEHSFEDVFMHPGASITWGMLALTRETRDYISEVAKNAGT